MHDQSSSDHLPTIVVPSRINQQITAIESRSPSSQPCWDYFSCHIITPSLPAYGDGVMSEACPLAASRRLLPNKSIYYHHFVTKFSSDASILTLNECSELLDATDFPNPLVRNCMTCRKGEMKGSGKVHLPCFTRLICKSGLELEGTERRKKMKQ